MKKEGFTLLEVITVIIIVGILASLGITNYSKTKEYALNKEAITNLKLLQSAEKSYKYEYDDYYPKNGSEANITNINQNLKTMLFSGSDSSWNYTVYNTGCVAAQRNIENGTKWWLNNTTAEPIQNDTVAPDGCQ